MEITTNGGRGLAPFDEPVYLEHAAVDEAAIGAPTDERSRPVIAFLCRSCLLAALAGALPFLTVEDLRLVVGLVVAVQVAATTVLDRARVGDERAKPMLAYLLALIDVASLAVLAHASGLGVVLTTLGPLLIAFHRWVYGRRAAASSVVTTVAALVALAALGVDDIDWFSIGAVGAVGSLLVWMVDDQATRHSQATAGLHLVATRAEAVLEGIGDAIVSTDEKGRVTGINPAAAHLLGCTPDEARGHGCHATLGLEAEGGRFDCGNGCALVTADGRSVEVRRTGPDSHRQPLLASAVALRDPEGSVIEVVHLLRDITQIKQADDAKTLFLATASHELKTPLAVISGYAQILRLPTVRPDDRTVAIDAIEARTTQLTNIVDRLLMSSRIDAGHIDLLVRPIPIDRLLRDHAVAFSAASRTVDLTIIGVLPHARVDYAALETVIDHLLDNAHKYSPDGSAIGLRAHGDVDFVHIEVTDGGIGMTQAQMDLCFERFWQAEGTDVRRFGGTGIGLYIVHSLVEAMEGSVSVRSNADRPGVTFTVSLRREPPEIPLHDPATSTIATGDGEESMIREFMRQVGVLSETGESR